MIIVLKWLMVFFYFRSCAGLYEDQIGKFEWRQQYVGKLKFAQFDVLSPIKKVLVATEQNVLAALSLKTGEIIWRQILESDDSGLIKLLSVDKEIVTVTGTTSPLVRGWNLEHGYLLWEWKITSTSPFTSWMSFKQKLLQIDFQEASHISLNLFHSSTGRKIKSQIIPASWVVPENCTTQNDVIACISNDKSIYSIKIIEDAADEIGINIHHRSLFDLFQQQVTTSFKTTAGKLPIVSVNVAGIDEAILLQPEIQVLPTGKSKSKIFGSTSVDQQNTIITSIAHQNEVLEITARSSEGTVLPQLTTQIAYDEANGHPEFALIYCQPRRDRGTACRLLVSTSHHVILLIQHPGKTLWTREESLSSILAVQLISLPVSDMDAAIEKEFDNKNGGFLSMFFRRIISQGLQLQNLILTSLGLLKGTSSSGDPEAMIQDEFGLHKLIVAVTKVGKIYGIDNLSGKIVWQLKLDGLEAFSAQTAMGVIPLYLLRNARHNPLPAECVLLAKDRATGETVLVAFNPIDGTFAGEHSVRRLGFRAKQSLLLSQIEDHFYRGIVLLDEDNKVHVYPESWKSVVLANPSSIYIFTADATSGILEGFSLSSDADGALIGSKTWQICLGSNIIAVVGKNRDEKVHSQGRVLGDRSVLYKYVNPNLITVVTRTQHPTHKTVINLHLVDVVSGAIVYSSSHRRAKEPVHIVHSENWLVYTYINDKYRRTELAALEMYEGKTQSNATVFSSVDSSMLLPIVERQAYILPANVLAMKETITKKGITSKHILVALSTGGILELPWAYADPRRPMTVTPEMREEGVIPYMPELPVPLEAIINHNQTVSNVRGLHTSSSGLESTCLVFAYGLDIFYTRVAPSKTFDLLKDDFDYYLITLVLVALTVISYVTKKLASRKALKQAWK